MSINLFDQKIGDAGALALAASTHLGALAWLDLAYNNLTKVGLEALCASPELHSLKWINLVSNKFPNPCDLPGGVDGDHVYEYDASDFGRELEQRFGAKRWLHWNPSDINSYAPDPLMFSGAPR